MSLTSYRTAPSRDIFYGLLLTRLEALCDLAPIRLLEAGSCLSSLERDVGDFTRFGGDLLSRGLSPSTIGAAVLNFRVRDGTGCFICAMTTKPGKIPLLPCAKQRRRAGGGLFACKCAVLHGFCFNQRCPTQGGVHVFDLSFHFRIKSSLSGD